MIRPTSFRLPQYIVERLSHLMDILRNEKEKYERASLTIEDKQLKQNIHILALENNQYVCELTSQLKSLGAYECIEKNELKNDVDVSTGTAEQNQPLLNVNVLQFCKDSEKKMISAYREVLNEPFLAEGLRTLIRTQLNGIMYAFLQLKLLQDTRYAPHH